MSLKIEKHEKIVMLAVSSLKTISNLISKALSDVSISDEENHKFFGLKRLHD